MRALLGLRKHAGLTAALIVVVAIFGVATAAAFNSPGTPDSLGSDTITWTGQGTTGGALNTVDCDANNTAYLLWVFTTDGGSASDPTLYVNGDPYSPDSNSGNTWKFITPYIAPSSITTAYADFTVDSLGNSDGGTWNLVISHGCSGTVPPAAGPSVIKDANGAYSNTYTWQIDKSVDKHYVEQVGGNVIFNYTVTVSHDSGTVGDVAVSGTITVTNPDGADETLDSVTDSLSDGTPCDVDTSSGLVVGDSATYPYTCSLSALPSGDLTNTVEIAWSTQDLDNGKHLIGGTASFTSDPITFTGNDIDECVDVTDPNSPNPPLPATVCVGDANPTTFNYSVTVPAPSLGNCVSVDNTATFTTNDTGTPGSDNESVRVCAFRAPLTIGYWSTHIRVCGPKEKNGTGGCNNNGPFTVSYLGTTICVSQSCPSGVLVGTLGNYYTGTGTTGGTNALAVFNANNCSNASTSDSNAAACLAAQLLAAELNVANSSNPCICSTIKDAIAFLAGVGYTGPGSKVTFTGTYTRAGAIALKTALDNYNNGKGCPA